MQLRALARGPIWIKDDLPVTIWKMSCDGLFITYFKLDRLICQNI
jgi:hypothetical protein